MGSHAKNNSPCTPPSSDKAKVKLLGSLLAVAMASGLMVAAVRGRGVSDGTVFEQDGALFSQIGVGGTAEQLADAAHYEKIDRPGSRFYVVLQWDQRRTWLKILSCQPGGLLCQTQTILDDKLNEVTAIDRAERLPDGRLSVLLHVNPSRSVMVMVDPQRQQATVKLRDWDDAGESK